MAEKIKMSENAKEFRSYVYKTYEQIKGRKYNPSWAKEGALCHLLCNRFPLPWLKGMWDFYLQWDNQFVKDGGYSVGVFYHMINQMLEMGIHKSHWTEKHLPKKGLSKVQEQDILNSLKGKK